MKIEDILVKYDTDSNFFDTNLFIDELKQSEDANENVFKINAEIIAQQLSEYNDMQEGFWKDCYFGPMHTWKTIDGQYIETPNRSDITSDVVIYWKNRLNVTKNTQLLNKYTGIVWDFLPKICHEKPNILIAETYIESLITIINTDVNEHSMQLINKAERAISLSKSLNKSELLDKAKSALSNLISKNTDITFVGIWASPYRIAQKYKNTYTKTEIDDMMEIFKNNFNDIYLSCISGSKTDPWLLMEIADLIASHYKKADEDTIGLFSKVEEVFELAGKNLSCMQLTGNLHNLHQLLKKHHLDEQATNLSKKISTISAGLRSEMNVFQKEFTISKNDMDVCVNSILKENSKDTITSIVSNFIPSKEKAKNQVCELARKFPLQYILSTSLLDNHSGRLAASVDSIENDIEGHIVLSISESLKFYSIFLHNVIEEAINRNLICENILIQLCKDSLFCNANRIPLLKISFEAYFKGDYISFMHITVPQIEASLINLFEKFDIATLKPAKNGRGFHLRLLDDMIRDPKLLQVLPEDLVNYLRILLTDNRGWNLRNDICHGIAEFENFNEMTADRVLHAFLCIINFQQNK